MFMLIFFFFGMIHELCYQYLNGSLWLVQGFLDVSLVFLGELITRGGGRVQGVGVQVVTMSPLYC